MQLEDYKTILYRQEDGSWVADVPAIPGCYALMPTREQALAELSNVFRMIAEEYSEKEPLCPPTPLKFFMPSATARQFQNAARLKAKGNTKTTKVN